MRKTLLGNFLIFLVTVGHAQLVLPSVFQNGMVLQRDKPIQIWGWSAPKSAIEVSFGGEKVSTKASKSGRWELKLDAKGANTEGQLLSVSDGKEKIELSDILLGDVWICSGQSNMQWRISQLPVAEQEAAKANFPNLRMITINR
ncbi:MAG: sialate O-acetylesterase, partial [Ekhidna sp.]|nr:sialate O-acetylesterase [Ekhidna sp.]